ncbi:hypothetical protein ACHAQJ_007881 [Trichoderma viride]
MDIQEACYTKLETPDSKPGFFQAIGSTVRILSKQSELKELRGRLISLRDQVSAHLIFLMREEQQKLSKTLRILATSNEELKKKFNDSINQVLDYLQVIASQTHSGSATAQHDGHRPPEHVDRGEAQAPIWEAELPEIRGLLKMYKAQEPFIQFVDIMERLTKRKLESILQTLYFAQVKEREYAVTEAHSSTLEWIFDEVHSTNFAKWLQEESNSIYWITGKAGSGKSTLMRFIVDHPMTTQLLQEWAGGKPLLTARHYFWSPGTSIQKSQEGLFKTLLLQILQQRQELIPIICADRWDTPLADAFYPWDPKELMEALGRLGKLNDISCKICLFIDGLDEYDGDHAQLITVIRKIGNSDRIKICTASRPWVEFSDAFEDSQWKLHLQDFTRGDIQRFVEENLQNNDYFDKLRRRNTAAADSIVLEITERAHGVFLWVFLVVRSLLRGLRYADDISDLQRRLRELPSGLPEYFERMLDSIEPVYKESVARLFLTMTYAKTTFPVITFYFMDLDDSPPSKEPLPFLREWPNVDSKEVAVLGQKKRQLIARCKDLIHITSHPDAPVLFSEQVGFLHRTVFDFIRTAGVNNRLVDLAGRTNFTPVKVLFGASIGQTRSFIHLHRLTYIKPYLQQWIIGSLYYAYLMEVSDGTAEMEALDELEAIIMKQFELWDFSHAMEYLFDIPRMISFLELACRCDLALYVSQKYPHYKPRELDKIAPRWKKLLQLQQDEDFILGFSEREINYDLDSDWRLGRQFGLLTSQLSASALEKEEESGGTTKGDQKVVGIVTQPDTNSERDGNSSPRWSIFSLNPSNAHSERHVKEKRRIPGSLSRLFRR